MSKLGFFVGHKNETAANIFEAALTTKYICVLSEITYHFTYITCTSFYIHKYIHTNVYITDIEVAYEGKQIS